MDPLLCYTEYEEEITDGTLICRVCFSMETTRLLNQSQAAAFTQTTGISVAEPRLPCALCATCAAYLHKAARFREASARADLVLRDLASRGKLSRSSIQTSHQEISKILPKLTINNLNYKSNEYSFIEDINITEISHKDIDNIPLNSDIFIQNKFNLDNKNIESNQTEIVLIKNEIITHSSNEFKSEMKKSKINTKPTDFSTIDIDSDNILNENNTNKDYNFEKEQKYKTEILKKTGKLKKSSKINNKRLKLTLNKDIHIDNDSFKEFFSLETLNKQQQMEEYGKRKESASYKNCRLKCDLCLTGFKHDQAFKAHSIKHSKKLGDLVCQICKIRYTNKTAYRNHRKYHIYKYSCKRCDYTTNAKSSATLHLLWHKGKQYECDICKQVFVRQSSLLSHSRIKHPSDYVCVLCGYSFLGEKGIASHRVKKHSLDNLKVDGGAPSCAECDITFCNEDALNTHRRVSPKHGGNNRNDPKPGPVTTKPLSKPKTSRKPPAPRGRKPAEPKPNQARHLEVQRYCEKCKRQFYSDRAYRLHVSGEMSTCGPIAATVPTSLCHTCGKTFKTAAILSLHMLKHKTTNSHTCDVCNKSFKLKQTLLLHKNIHSDTKYPCPLCGKTFNQAFNRDRHYTFVHKTIKDVRCDYCEKCFKSEYLKKAHIIYVHFKRPFKRRSRNRRQDDCLTLTKKDREDFTNQEIWTKNVDSSEKIT